MTDLIVDRAYLEEILLELHYEAFDKLNAFLNGPAPDLLPVRSVDLLDQMVLIVVEGEPQGKNRPRFAARNGFVQVFTDDRTKEYELLIQMEAFRVIGGQALVDQVMSIRRRTIAEAYEAFGHKPLFSCPVRIEMEIRHSVRPSWTKAKKAGVESGAIAATVKVDFDNCAKVFCDAFNGIVWADDTQVVDARIVKLFAEDPSVLVRVIPLDLLPA